MKKIVLALLVLILFGIIFINVLNSNDSEPSSNIYGVIVDDVTLEPLPNLEVFINIYDYSGKKYRIRTDSEGKFVFKDFPPNEKEHPFIIDIRVHENDFPERNYYKQRYEISLNLFAGKNLHMNPVRIKRGSRFHGSVKLSNGTPVKKGRIIINPKNRSDLSSVNSTWGTYFNSEDEGFTSPLVPIGIELEVIADYLQNENINTAYGRQINFITISNSPDANSLNIVIPDSTKEVKGIVTDFNGIPLSNQLIYILYKNIHVKTSNQGEFWFKSLSISEFQLEFGYEDQHQHKIKTFSTKKLPISFNEKFFFKIMVSSSDFRYEFIRKQVLD